jgi:hypothetical protein
MAEENGFLSCVVTPDQSLDIQSIQSQVDIDKSPLFQEFRQKVHSMGSFSPSEALAEFHNLPKNLVRSKNLHSPSSISSHFQSEFLFQMEDKYGLKKQGAKFYTSRIRIEKEKLPLTILCKIKSDKVTRRSF